MIPVPGVIAVKSMLMLWPVDAMIGVFRGMMVGVIFGLICLY